MLIDVIGRWLARRRVPTFYLNVVAGLLATLAAATTTLIGVQQTPSLVVAGSIVVLLPGGTLVNGVRDAISGYVVTGTARVFEVLLVVAGLVAGVASGLALVRAFGVDMSVNPDTLGLDALPVRVISAAVAATAAAVTFYTPTGCCPPPRCRAPSPCSCCHWSKRSAPPGWRATRWRRSSSASVATSWPTPSGRCP